MKPIGTYILDVALSVMLLFLMAVQVTGDKAHEWLGMAMLVGIVAHNVLNMAWYAALFRGRYTMLRASRTLVNILLLVAMSVTMASGIMLNNYVLPLPVGRMVAVAQEMHLAGSSWSFVLMSIHIGLHWGIVVGLVGKKTRRGAFVLLRLLAAGVAAYGGYAFVRAGIVAYMTLRASFAFIDYDRPSLLVLGDHVAMMSFWVFLSYYATRLMHGLGRRRSRSNEEAV